MAAPSKSTITGLIITAIFAMSGVAWFFWSQNSHPADNPPIKASTSASSKVTYKTMTVNGYKLKYPENANNDQVIVEDIGNPYSPQIAYAPVRQYFMASTVEACQKASKGLMQVDTLDNLMNSIDPTDASDHAANLTQIKGLIDSGQAVKLGEDLYALSPRKQNETCAELANPKDGKLQIALFESQDIEKNWLKSLQLDQ